MESWRESSKRLLIATEEFRLRVLLRALVGIVGFVLKKCSAVVRISLRMEKMWIRFGLLVHHLCADEDSPQQYGSRNHQNGHQQAPDFGYSPNPHNGNSSHDRTSYEPESKLKTAPARREPAFRPKPNQGASLSAPTQNKQKEVEIDPDRFASARKRLQENYQEAKNAKKQRTIQVMDIHEIPKPKNGFIARNKGGFHGRH